MSVSAEFFFLSWKTTTHNFDSLATEFIYSDCGSLFGWRTLTYYLDVDCSLPWMGLFAGQRHVNGKAWWEMGHHCVLQIDLLRLVRRDTVRRVSSLCAIAIRCNYRHKVGRIDRLHHRLHYFLEYTLAVVWSYQIFTIRSRG